MIEKALELGLCALTFTDHADVNDYFGSYYNESKLMPQGAKAIPPLIEEYADRIKVGFGAEVGQFMQNPALARQLIADFKLDYVIGSTHNVKGHEDFFFLDFTVNDANQFMRLYLEETLEMAQEADIDVIGHLTYPLRYITGTYNVAVNMSVYTEIMQEICRTAAGRGIGLEINTGGLRKRNYSKADPGLEYVKMFREAGGEVLTIGSDAHRTSDLAANFSAGAEIAKSAGFRQIAYFEKRKPVFINL
jgi:histidinol-phosphatase (PHP family)